MQDAYVATLLLQLANNRDHATETARITVLDGADAVGVVQMYERDARNSRWLLRRLLRRSTTRCDDNRADGDEQGMSNHE